MKQSPRTPETRGRTQQGTDPPHTDPPRTSPCPNPPKGGFLKQDLVRLIPPLALLLGTIYFVACIVYYSQQRKVPFRVDLNLSISHVDEDANISLKPGDRLRTIKTQAGDTVQPESSFHWYRFLQSQPLDTQLNIQFRGKDSSYWQKVQISRAPVMRKLLYSAGSLGVILLVLMIIWAKSKKTTESASVVVVVFIGYLVVFGLMNTDWMLTSISLFSIFLALDLITLPLILHLFLKRPQIWKPIANMEHLIGLIYVPQAILLAYSLLVYWSLAINPTPANQHTMELLGDFWLPAGSVLYGLAALGLTVHRLLTSAPKVRKQLLWLFYGLAVASLTSVAFLILRWNAGAYHWIFGGTDFLLPIYALLAAGVAFSFIPSQLDVSRIANRGIVYAALTILISGVYLGAAGLLSLLVSRLMGGTSTTVTILATIVATALFFPLRDFVQKSVDRLFFPHRNNYTDTIADISHDLLSILKLQQLLGSFMERLLRDMQILYGSTILIVDEEKENLASGFVVSKNSPKSSQEDKSSRLRADSKIRSQDRGRRGTRPVRREEGEYIDVFNRRATQQVGMDRRTNPEVIFESALKLVRSAGKPHKTDTAELQKKKTDIIALLSRLSRSAMYKKGEKNFIFKREKHLFDKPNASKGKRSHDAGLLEFIFNALDAQVLMLLTYEKEPLGFVALGPRQSELPYTKDELEVFRAVTPQLSMAVRNAGAYSTIHSLNRDLKQKQKEILQLQWRLKEENTYLRQAVRRAVGSNKIIGDSQRFNLTLEEAQKAAQTDSTVLIMGETGTGKELIARFIHESSNRSDKPLVTVNCAAIPEGLLESELFGHERGAFTGAISKKKGHCELADKGTLFLDEIGDMPLSLQAKLLRVLEDGSFTPLGGNRSLNVDIRILAATNRNLQNMVESSAFRQDLYYRLHVIPLEIPPVRERVDDIRPLAEHYLEQAARKMGKDIKGISERAMNAMTKYSWPGNVRELANTVERAVVLSRGEILDGELIPAEVLQETTQTKKTNTLLQRGNPPGEYIDHLDDLDQIEPHLTEKRSVAMTEGSDFAELMTLPFHDAVDAFKQLRIENAIKANTGNKSAAARELGLQRTYLYKLLNQISPTES